MANVNSRQQMRFVLLALLLLSGCSSKEKHAVEHFTPVKVDLVELDSPEEGPRYSGTIEPAARIDMSFRLGGYVEEVYTVPDGRGGMRPVYDGDFIPKGTALAKLRQSDYRIKVDQARSQLGQAEAAVKQIEDGVHAAKVLRDKAKLDFDRASALYAKQSLTKTDMDGARAQLDGAQAQLDGAEAQLPLAKERISGAKALVEEAELAQRDTFVYSPVDALLLKRVIEVGSLVGPGTPTFILADVRSLKAIFGAPDNLLSSLKLGMTLSFTADAAPGTFTGTVTTIAPVADPQSRMFNVEAVFPNTKNILKPGMIVSLQLPAKSNLTPTLVVPMSSVVQGKSGDEDYEVFVAQEQGAGRAAVHVRKVTLGGALKSRLIVTSGLNAGEKIVVTGTTLLKDGEIVQLVP